MQPEGQTVVLKSAHLRRGTVVIASLRELTTVDIRCQIVGRAAKQNARRSQPLFSSQSPRPMASHASSDDGTEA
jgi:hypothetical protein